MDGQPTSATVNPRRNLPGYAKVLLWFGLFLFLVVMAIILYQSQRGYRNIGEYLSDFSLETFDGNNIRLSELHGQVVVINFWASWCEPCADEAAFLEKAWQKYKPTGKVSFIGIDYVDTEPDALKYLQKFAITYPNGADRGTRISQSFRIRGVPETYILDRGGALVYYKIGPFVSYDEIVQQIDGLLKKE